MRELWKVMPHSRVPCGRVGRNTVTVDELCILDVASRVDAWVETSSRRTGCSPTAVASRVDAWVETNDIVIDHLCENVASRVDAWVETR